MTVHGWPRTLASISFICLTFGCDEGFSDADRRLLRDLGETQADAAVTGGFTEADRDALNDLADRVDALSADAGAPVGPGGGCLVYARGVERITEDGKYVLRLLRSTPEPELSGPYLWRVQLLDLRNEPVTGAKLTVEPYMPAHGHGTSAVMVSSLGEGQFSFKDMNLYMGGLWEVRVDIEVEDQTSRVVFPVCLNEAPKPATIVRAPQLYVFSHDEGEAGSGDDKAWVSIVHPDTAKVSKTLPIARAMWGAAVASRDGRRIFVSDHRTLSETEIANGATHRVHVFDPTLQILTASVDVGLSPARPVRVDDTHEVWVHADESGGYHAIEQTLLSVSAPIGLSAGSESQLALGPTGLAMATRTDVGALFPVELAARRMGYGIEVCQRQDGTGGASDVAFSPFNGLAYVRCSGPDNPGYAIVDVARRAVEVDHGGAPSQQPLAGALQASPDGRFMFVLDAESSKLSVFDTLQGADTQLDHQWTLPASPLGTVAFYLPRGEAGAMRAYIPLATGTALSTLDLGTLLSDPDPAQALSTVSLSATAAGAGLVTMAGDRVALISDAGLLLLDAQAPHEASTPIAINGQVDALVFVDTTSAADP